MRVNWKTTKGVPRGIEQRGLHQEVPISDFRRGAAGKVYDNYKRALDATLPNQKMPELPRTKIARKSPRGALRMTAEQAKKLALMASKAPGEQNLCEVGPGVQMLRKIYNRYQDKKRVKENEETPWRAMILEADDLLGGRKAYKDYYSAPPKRKKRREVWESDDRPDIGIMRDLRNKRMQAQMIKSDLGVTKLAQAAPKLGVSGPPTIAKLWVAYLMWKTLSGSFSRGYREEAENRRRHMTQRVRRY